jgi:hypothetical protein
VGGIKIDLAVLAGAGYAETLDCEFFCGRAHLFCSSPFWFDNPVLMLNVESFQCTVETLGPGTLLQQCWNPEVVGSTHIFA